jgi:hypothetical protein
MPALTHPVVGTCSEKFARIFPPNFDSASTTKKRIDAVEKDRYPFEQSLDRGVAVRNHQGNADHQTQGAGEHRPLEDRVTDRARCRAENCEYQDDEEEVRDLEDEPRTTEHMPEEATIVVAVRDACEQKRRHADRTPKDRP